MTLLKKGFSHKLVGQKGQKPGFSDCISQTSPHWLLKSTFHPYRFLKNRVFSVESYIFLERPKRNTYWA